MQHVISRKHKGCHATILLTATLEDCYIMLDAHQDLMRTSNCSWRCTAASGCCCSGKTSDDEGTEQDSRPDFEWD